MSIPVVNPEIPVDMVENINKISMTSQKVAILGSESGVAEVAEGLNEMDFEQDESEFKDPGEKEPRTEVEKMIWSGFEAVGEAIDAERFTLSEHATGSEKQMTSRIIDASIGAMTERIETYEAPPKRAKIDSGEKVRSWETTRTGKLNADSRKMMIDLAETIPNVTIDMFDAAYYGWVTHGEQNVREVKNVLQSISESVNQSLTNNSKFQKNADGLFQGFSNCQKEIQTIIHHMKSEQGKYMPPTEVKAYPREIIAATTVVPVAQSYYTPTGNMVADMKMFLDKLSKTPLDYAKYCDAKTLGEVVTSIIRCINQDDWKLLEHSAGKLAMSDLLGDAINALLKGKGKEAV